MIPCVALLLLQTAALPAAPSAPTLKSEAARLGTTPLKLAAALTSRERSPRYRRGERRYCIADAVTDPAHERLVCRPLADWHALGFELADEGATARPPV